MVNTNLAIFITRDAIIRNVTENFIKNLNPTDPTINHETLANNLTALTQQAIANENFYRPKGRKIREPEILCPSQTAELMMVCYTIRSINCLDEHAEPNNDMLALYNEFGPNEGIYTRDVQTFKKCINTFVYSADEKYVKETMAYLRTHAKRVCRTIDKDIIPVNNGIFNFKNKTLMPFDPDMVFISKIRVDYRPLAPNPIIINPDGTPWDIETWVDGLSPDKEIVNLIWEIMSAIVRPFVRWDKAAWLYSQEGCNGKGSLCTLMRNLVGAGSCAAMALTDFSKDFGLTPLLNATAIINDENDVGGYVDKAANLKTTITGDVLNINIKHENMINFRFLGFMVQCLNEYPRIRDRSSSVARRMLLIPMEKCFTGKDRKYIKDDYLYRKEVLEYVLYKVMNMSHYTLSEPEACKRALAEYREFNDPVRQFLAEVLSLLVWDLVPGTFLYDLYKSWFRKNNPNGVIEGKQKFYLDVKALISEYPEWIFDPKEHRPKHKMDKAEYLISEYDLKDWQNPGYVGSNIDSICLPKLKDHYNNCLLRVKKAKDGN